MSKVIPFRRRRPPRQRSWWVFVPLWAATVMVGTAYGADWISGPKIVSPPSSFTPSLSRFGSCHVGGGRNCVIDGDTFRMEGEKIRIAGIDAPETHPPRCQREAELGKAATARLRELLNSGSVTLTSIDRDRDSYGRKLRNVQVNGADVGRVLVSEGLARWYGGGKQPWC